jgi:predicted transcriptional regulator
MAIDPAPEESAQGAIPELHELQFAVMERVWRLGGRVTVHDVLKNLNAADPQERAYTTILSVMRRLHEKGFLNRERQNRSDYYTPQISREEYAHSQTRHAVDQLVDQYGEVALAHFARQVEQLSLERLAELRKLADRE